MQALELIRAKPPLGQRNALATMYLLPYDVATAEIPQTFAKVQAELVASLRQRNADLDAGREVAEDAFSVLDRGLAQRFIRLLPTQPPSIYCTKLDDCLAKVKRDPEAIRKALAPFAKLPDRVALLRNFDSLDFSPLPMDARLPLPYLQYGTPTLIGFALRAADGDAAGAVVETCEFIALSRRLRSSYSLIVNMIGLRHLQIGVRLIAEIQAANPSLELPPNCSAALTLLSSAEQSLCNAMRGEFALASGLFDQLNNNTNEVDGKRAKPFAS